MAYNGCMGAFIDMKREPLPVGSLWSVVGPHRRQKIGNGRIRTEWWCRCECGTERWVPAGDLRNGKSSNCGCVRRAAVGARNRTHGLTQTREYQVWSGMIARCENPKHKGFPRYGGRGIKVCRRWRRSFVAFMADMGKPPTDKHQVDRRNNDKGYCPSNCRWVLNVENSRNRPSAHKITFQGRERPLNEWAEILGYQPKTIYNRIFKLGWSIEKALTTPLTFVGRRGSGRKDQSPV